VVRTIGRVHLTTSARRLSEPLAVRRAVLDSDVIFSRVLHDLFGRLAAGERLFTLIWSDELLNEAQSALLRRKVITPEAAERWVGYLASSFPDERIDLATVEDIPGLSATTLDPDDEHVCALAIAGRADLLITGDRGYLSEALRSYGVAVMRPDDALMSVFDERSPAILAVLEAQAAAWAGGRPVDELLDAITRAGATMFAGVAREALLG
jgi:predicted nucleic acid-binding protein